MRKLFALLLLFACTTPAHANQTNYLSLDTVVTDESVDPLIEALESPGNVVIVIDSPGGSVPAGLALSKAIEQHDGTVACVVDGMAASMALYILQSCDVRLMTKRSTLMAHEISLSGVMEGNPNNWQAVVAMMKALNRALLEHTIHRTNASFEEAHANTVGGLQWWMNWDEALARGFVDRVVPQP